ncbi:MULTISPECIES: GntR family transcriptional regulator [unclassified Arthrobacter]|jgi:DNA-binding GntR family transcriptional regulator|uniref:GntR family transcriptional regulator n=1 Tax=unclassified Arthrobacter TaxID=235627 RepID=UPI0009A91528|nr:MULTISPECIES: GntR family transcriptional regulator [unclassified Arthrobacter]RDV12442.1 GntR family transcriptional regulator [Arthrobacter sp. RT-1]
MGKMPGTAASGREKAYIHLRENVLTDPELQGRFLNETELAADIGVSRTPVREALLLLVSDGLVELIPQRGAYVPAITGREISELMELRGVLENYAARLVIAEQRVPAGLMQETLDLQARIPDTESPGDAREFIRLDTLFHQQLIDAAGNELISRTYSKLHVRQILVGVAALFRTGGRRQDVCAEHQGILDALVAGDAVQAQKAIDEHLAVTRDILLRT